MTSGDHFRARHTSASRFPAAYIRHFRAHPMLRKLALGKRLIEWLLEWLLSKFGDIINMADSRCMIAEWLTVDYFSSVA